MNGIGPLDMSLFARVSADLAGTRGLKLGRFEVLGTSDQLDNRNRHVAPSGRASVALVFVLCGIAALTVGRQKGEAMAQRMGTQYDQEQVRDSREKATTEERTSVAKKLRRLADRLDRMAPEFYFQPLEGAPEMERLSHGLDELLSKLDACEETGGDPRLRTPFFGEVESILDHHKRY